MMLSLVSLRIAIEKEVEGIWASAIDAYLSKQPWHLSQIEEQAREKLNKKFQLSDEWENPIGDYLQQVEANAIASGKEPLVSIKELLKLIGQNPDDRNSQHRVAKILTSLSWKKLGQRTINGLRQYVWTNPSVVLNPIEVKHEVKQPETTDIQGLSYPTYPTYPNLKTTKEEISNTLNEEENTSHESCKEVSSNRISRISRSSNPSHSKASSSTYPTTQPQLRSSNQVVTAPNPSFTESVVDDNDVTVSSSSDEEEKYLQPSDLAGNPLEVGDYIQPSNDESAVKDWETLNENAERCSEVENNPVARIIAIERQNNHGTEGLFLVGQLINGVQFYYYLLDNSQQTGSSFLIEKRIRKMLRQDDRWVVATI